MLGMSGTGEMLGMSGTGGMPGTGEFAIFFVFDGFAWLFVGLKVLKTTFSVLSKYCAPTGLWVSWLAFDYMPKACPYQGG